MNSIPGISRNGAENKTATSIIMLLYKISDTTTFGILCTILSAHLKKDIINLENAQERATQTTMELKQLPNEQRGKRLGEF